MKLAIVGSTRLAGNVEAQRVIDFVLDLMKPDVVVSGDADGIDTMAKNSALARGIPYSGHPPKVRQWKGPGGYEERNIGIATECTHLVRIPWAGSKTYGSGWTRDYAARLGKPTAEWIIQ